MKTHLDGRDFIRQGEWAIDSNDIVKHSDPGILLSTGAVIRFGLRKGGEMEATNMSVKEWISEFRRKSIKQRIKDFLPGKRNRKYDKIKFIQGKRYRVSFNCYSSSRTFRKLKITSS